MAVLKELILILYTLGDSGDLEGTHFNSFYFDRVWSS